MSDQSFVEGLGLGAAVDTGIDGSEPPEIDAGYDDIFGSDLSGTDEPDRQLGSEPVPSFDFYVVTAQGGRGEAAQTGNLGVVVPLVVNEGPDGTVGRSIFGRMYFSVNKTKRVKDEISSEMIDVPRTAEEMQEARDRIAGDLKRAAVQLGFINPTPAAKELDAITSYAGQFADKQFVVAVRLRKAQGEFPASNNVIWRSISALDGPAKDSKGNVIAGKTALDEAREKIMKYNEKHKDGGPTGRTARGVGGGHKLFGGN